MNETRQPTTAVVDASQHVRSFVELHGRLAVTILLGGAASALGTIVPFAHVYGLFGGGGSYAIIQSGFYGLVLLAVAVILGILPVFLKRHMRFKLAAFGLSCALFGIFFAMWLAASGIAGAIGSGVGGFSIGFYLCLFGYAAMVIGYYLIQSESEGTRV